MIQLKAPLLFVLVIIFLPSCAYKADEYVISNVTIIDPLDGLRENMTVVIKGGKIATIVVGDEYKSNNLTPFDGSVKYLIPGLWDSHVHFSYDKTIAEHMPDLFVAHGVLSVRDTGGEINYINDFKSLLQKRPYAFPRIKVAGPLLDGRYPVYDGRYPSYPALSIGNMTADELEQQVLYLIANDVDFLKAYEMLSEVQLLRLIKIARKHNLKVDGYVPLSMDAIVAAELGINSFEHLRNIILSVAKNHQELLMERLEMLKNPDNLSGHVL